MPAPVAVAIGRDPRGARHYNKLVADELQTVTEHMRAPHTIITDTQVVSQSAHVVATSAVDSL